MLMSPVVQVTDGAVELGGRPVLRGIDVAVRAGEVLAVLGANGSGKSTLVRTMMGLVPTVRGEVRLFGTPRADFREWHRVGFVPQRVTAASGVPASVREVVASGRLSRRRAFWPRRREDREAVEQAIDAVGLSDKARDGVSTLSGGQQQRVLIARALAGVPDLLVLDEPTAGVDLAHQEVLATLLRRMIASGTSVLVVLHEVAALAPLIGRALVLREGRVVHDGPLAGLVHGHRSGHEHEHPSPHRRLLDGTVEQSWRS